MTREMDRYHRQIILDGWGVEAQERLGKAKVFIAGIGGLGCPAALGLTLAGVGHIKICDADRVDVTNLNRQFLYQEAGIGREKTGFAKERLLALNSNVHIETVSEKITHKNVDELVSDSQIIIDCLDNFPARYAINQCAIRKHIPLVHGAVWGMEGRLTVFHPPVTPCLSCIFPAAPENTDTPVLGAVTSAVGSMQAIEAIRFLIGAGTALEGRLLVMDFSTMKFQELELPKNPSCLVCGS